jgi:flagellar assembly factor FliW
VSAAVLGTRYHGTLRVNLADQISCPVRGLPDTWYLLPLHAHLPWLILQAANMPALALPVCDPQVFWPSYALPPDLPVAADDPTQRAVLVIVTAGAHLTANLKAPLCIDRRTRRGEQIVLDLPYAIREPVPLFSSRRATPHVVSHS